MKKIQVRKVQESVSATADVPVRVSLEERVNSIPSHRIVEDGDNWIMRDVVLLSEFSKNPGPSGKPRRYSKETQQKALNLFEGLQVNVNHPPKDGASGAVQSSQRDVLRTLGKVTSPRLRESTHDGKKVTQTVGDVVMIKCDASEHIVKLAKLDSRLAGMSITGDGEYKLTEGFDCIEDLKPTTVDVVHRPATTKGFFEAVESNQVPLSELTGKIEAFLAEQLQPIPEAEIEEILKGLPDEDEEDDEDEDEDGTPEHEDQEDEETEDEEQTQGDTDEDDDMDGEAGDEDETEDFDYGQDADEDGIIGNDRDDDDNTTVQGELGDDAQGDVDGEGGEDEEGARANKLIAITDEANAATFDARHQRTAQAHMEAAYAHAGAAAQSAKFGDHRRAYLHWEKAKEHEAVANKMKDTEKNLMNKQPSPEASLMAGNEVTKLGQGQPVMMSDDTPAWLQEVYDCK